MSCANLVAEKSVFSAQSGQFLYRVEMPLILSGEGRKAGMFMTRV
jgi:hypothetical protein